MEGWVALEKNLAHFRPTVIACRNHKSNTHKEKGKLKKQKPGTYLISPLVCTSERSFVHVMAMTRANIVTKVVIKAAGELQVEIDVSKF